MQPSDCHPCTAMMSAAAAAQAVPTQGACYSRCAKLAASMPIEDQEVAATVLTFCSFELLSLHVLFDCFYTLVHELTGQRTVQHQTAQTQQVICVNCRTCYQADEVMCALSNQASLLLLLLLLLSLWVMLA